MICKTSIRLTLGMMLFICIGCTMHNGEQKSQNQSAKAQVQINWIANWNGRAHKKKLVLDAAKEFEFLNQDIKINIKFQEQVCNNCSNTVMAMQDSIVQIIQSKHYNWDIVTVTQKDYLQVGKILNDQEWGKKYLVNFEAFDWFRASQKPIVFEVKQYREDLGGIFAGPLIEGRYFSLWYNTKTAKKIGLHIKQTGMTFEDFEGYIKQADQYNKTANEKIRLLYEQGSSFTIPEIFNTLVLSALGTVDTSRVDLSKSLTALRKALKACESLAIYNPFDATLKLDDKADAFLEEKALFGVFVSSYINSWEASDSAKALNMVPAELPVFEKPGMYFHGSYQSVWAIFKDAPHREEAIKFMKFMCSEDIAEKWISTTKNPTAINVRMNVSELSHDEISKFNSEIEKKYGKNMCNYNITRILFGPKSKIILNATKVIQGSISADEYYEQIVKQLKKS